MPAEWCVIKKKHFHDSSNTRVFHPILQLSETQLSLLRNQSVVCRVLGGLCLIQRGHIVMYNAHFANSTKLCSHSNNTVDLSFGELANGGWILLCRVFEMVSRYCEVYNNLIPVAFVLGFYVSLVLSRWWEQFNSIPWPGSNFVCTAEWLQAFIHRSVGHLNARSCC